MADISKEQQDAILFIEFLEVAFKLGRNAGLEEAKQVCFKEESAPIILLTARESINRIAAAIESLKDDTP